MMHFVAGKRGIRGMTVIEVLAVTFVIVILVGMILSVGNSSRCGKTEIKCANNLKNVGLALRIFATDNDNRFPFEVSTSDGGSRELHAQGEVFHTFKALSNEFSTPKIIVCPQDKKKTIATGWTNLSNANISYFLNIAARAVDDNTSQPELAIRTTNARQQLDWLGGDRDLTINGRRVSPGRLGISQGASAAFDKDFHGTWGNLLRADGSVEQLSGQRLLSETNHEPYVLLIP